MRNYLIASMLLALVACGSKEDEPGQSAVQTGPRPVVVGDESVAAVKESSGAPVARLRFVIDSRPVVGKPFQVRLLASSDAPVPALHLVAESTGLVLETSSADLSLELEGGAEGAGRTYGASFDLSVLAQEAGLAEVSIRLQSGAETPETLYVIPVLVAAKVD